MLGRLNTFIPHAANNVRHLHIAAKFPEATSVRFKNDVNQYLDNKDAADKKSSLNIQDMNKAMAVAGKHLRRILEENKNNPQVAQFIQAVDEYKKPDGKAKVLVIKDMPSADSNKTLLKQYAVLGVAHMLGGNKLWEMPQDSVLAKAGYHSSPVFDVTATHDGHQDAAQQPHVDQYTSLSSTPPLAALYCESNEQKTPTYFISAQAIWDKLDANDRKILTGDNFMLTHGAHHSEPFPIFKIKGEHSNPASIEICFDLDSGDFKFRPDAKESFYRLHEIVAEFARPYHEQKNIPANSDKTSQHTSESGDLVFWTNKMGMHGRPQVQYRAGASVRKLERFYFSENVVSDGKQSKRPEAANTTEQAVKK